MNKGLGCMNTRGKIPYQSICQIYCTANMRTCRKLNYGKGGKKSAGRNSTQQHMVQKIMAPSYV